MSLVSQEAVASTETATATATETATATTTTATTTTATTNTLVGDLVPPQPEIAYYANTDAHEKPTPATAESNTSCEDDNDDDDNDEGSTFWDMFSTWYLPLLLLWLRRSMFGTANLVRSLLVGQCIRILLTQCGDLPKWAQPFTDPHAWPPPAFTALAILTFVAFIVHPDGLTWFMLGKLRDAILSLLHSLLSCWTMFIQDYGIITTTIALMTLAGIGCLLGILLKNALPKHASKRTQSHDRKKKKRKGLKGKGRIRQYRKSVPEPEVVHDVKPMDEDSPRQVPDESMTVVETHVEEPMHDSIVTELLHSPTIPEEPLTPTPERSRVQSSSTVDTFADDASCDSVSIRSFSSAPTAVTVGSTGNSESGKSVRRSNKNNSNASKNQRKTHNNSNKSGTLGGGGRKVAAVVDTPETSSSRQPWSSQKPVASNRNQHPQDVPPRRPLQTGKPLAQTTGRFANLKEKDTRFESSRRIVNRPITGKGRNVPPGGRSNKNSAAQSSDPFLHSSTVPAKQSHNNGQGPITVTPQINSTSTQHFGSSVQYGSPYSSDAGYRTTQKKQELASFVATVGIVGSDAAALVANVADIDGLEHLSDIQFQLYGVGSDNQVQLGLLLAQRRRRRRNIRPPPGLSPIHDEPPTLFGSPNGRVPLVNLSSQVSAAPATQFPSTHPFAYAYDYSQQQEAIDDEESRIEAELQELGGKMVGSVLDF